MLITKQVIRNRILMENLVVIDIGEYKWYNFGLIEEPLFNKFSINLAKSKES